MEKYIKIDDLELLIDFEYDEDIKIFGVILEGHNIYDLLSDTIINIIKEKVQDEI